METVIGILSFFLLAFPKPIELARPHKDAAVHPPPIQLHAHDFLGFFLPWNLRAAIWYVGTGKEMGQEYVIGVIIGGDLRPILAPRADLHNNLGRVKLRIESNVANVTVPILEDDPLNRLFYKTFEPQNIRAAEIIN